MVFGIGIVIWFFLSCEGTSWNQTEFCLHIANSVLESATKSSSSELSVLLLGLFFGVNDGGVA